MTYYTEPAPEEGEYYVDDYAETAQDNLEDLSASASIPWVGMAMAFHCLLVAVAWFIVPAVTEAQTTDVLTSSIEQTATPPEPVLEPEPAERDFDTTIDAKPSEVDMQLVKDPEDVTNEDDTDSPHEELAKNSDSNSNSESPHPANNPNSSLGLGGPMGGGGGPSGGGGFKDRRGPASGPTIKTKPRVDAGLQWLADHQNQSGFWSATTFSDDTKRTNARRTYNLEFVDAGEEDGDKGWETTTDIGLTGLALLAFAGEGYDHRTGQYREVIRRGIQYLRRNQDQEGCFGARDDDHFVYNHSICTMAMAELYGLSLAPLMREPVQKAMSFILRSQNPGNGWRYGVQPGVNDVSVTGWMVLALKSCKMAGIDFDSKKVYGEATGYLDLMTIEVDGYSRTGYRTPGSPSARLRGSQDFDQSPSMESIHIMCDLFTGTETPKSPQMRELANICAEKKFLPKWEAKRINYYYWYYASLALHQMGGSAWDRWESAMSKTLMNNQRGFGTTEVLETKKTLDEHGSWDAVGAWCPAGGRVYSTAMNCLTLQVWYRYQRVEKNK